MPNDTQRPMLEFMSYGRSFESQFGGFMNFSNTQNSKRNPISSFFPKHCLSYNGEKNSPVIAYSGTPKYTDPLVADLTKLCKYNLVEHRVL